MANLRDCGPAAERLGSAMSGAFTMGVTLKNEDGKRNQWTIVGEDEPDAASAMTSHISPMAVALFGLGVGDAVRVNGREWEIVGIK